MTGQELFDSLVKAFGEKLQSKTEFRGETTYTIAGGDLREIVKFCRDELSFDYLLDITSIDNHGEEPRFEIVYHLYSMPHTVHLRFKLKVSEEIGAVDTVSDIWPTANWHEREITERNARCRLHKSHAAGRWTVRHNSEYRRLKGPRTARPSTGIISPR